MVSFTQVIYELYNTILNDIHMKIEFYISIIFALICPFLAAQIGVNNSAPQATFDVAGFASDSTKPDGLIPPRLTGDQLRAKDAGYLGAQTGAIVYVTDAFFMCQLVFKYNK